MSYIVLGNAIALVASLLMVYTGFLKKRKKILYVQIIHLGLAALSKFILGGITGAINNLICCVRDVLCCKNKLGIKSKIVIIISSTILTLQFNDLGIIGILPLIAVILVSWFIDIKDIIKFKTVFIIAMLLWFNYDIYIKSYTSAVFSLANIIANVISVWQIYKIVDKRKKGKRKSNPKTENIRKVS